MSHRAPGGDGSFREGDTLRLSRLMDVDVSARTTYEPGELAAILEHQLATPLRVDLGAVPGTDGNTGERWLDLTFGRLLADPSPPVEALRRVKEFAKAARGEQDGPLPPEIATVLYYASIAAARARCGRRISGLDDAAVRQGIERMRGEPWCATPLRALWNEALVALGGQSV